MDNCCVIGYGMVGKATAEVFGIEKHFDINQERSNITLEEASKCRKIFICLPTPVNNEGNYSSLSEIKKIIDQIEQFETGPIYIIRSTVFPGFAKSLGIDRIISNPEFLSEKTAVEDMKNPPFILIGGSEGIFRDEVKAFYEARIKGAPVIMTDNTTAEMIKLTLNAYFATKVIFANQVYDSCRRRGINYETLRKTLEAHPYGPKNHFDVWFNGKRGVNGSCLPKDTKAFANYTNSELVKTVVALNQHYIFIKNDDEI